VSKSQKKAHFLATSNSLQGALDVDFGKAISTETKGGCKNGLSGNDFPITSTKKYF